MFVLKILAEKYQGATGKAKNEKYQGATGKAKNEKDQGATGKAKICVRYMLLEL